MQLHIIPNVRTIELMLTTEYSAANQIRIYVCFNEVATAMSAAH